jgi:hypothetical protein
MAGAGPPRFDELVRFAHLAAGTAALLAAGSALFALPADAAARASCPVRATIYGTTGNDTVNGTPGNDVICAGAGNDRINGRGGNDRVYAGAGNDKVTTLGGIDYVFAGSGSDVVDAGAGSDLIYGDNPTTSLRDKTDTGADGADVLNGGLASDSIEGGGGNDLIFTGGDGTSRPSASITHGGPGNDVILSDFRHPALAEYMYGDAGSDLLWPNPTRLTPLGNTAIGGAGNDAIILLNGLPDGAHMGDLASSVKFPLGKLCSVSVPLPDRLIAGSHGKLTCKLPVDVKVPGLVKGIDLSVSVDSSGKTSTDVSVKPSPELAEVQGWVNVARGGFPSDMCICDPKLPGWMSMLGDTVYS